MSSVSRAIACCFAGGRLPKRAHIVEAIGELDDDDADVFGHRQEHLAKVLDLRVFLRLIGDPGQLGHALNQPRDLFAELLGDLLAGDRRVFDDVVQQRRGNRLMVHLEVGQDAGDGERMLDERLARGAALALVGGVGQLVGARQPLRVGGGVVVADALDELGDGHGVSAYYSA